MKKLLIVLFAILFAAGAFAQKIKIEKKTGLVYIDNTEVAKLSTGKNAEKQDVYTFTDLKSDDWVTLTMVKLDKDEENFLRVTSSLSDKTSEMEWELLTFTLSMNSGISNLIIKKHEFFTPEGMNKDAIVQFLDREDSTHQQAHVQNIEARQAVQNEIDAFAPFPSDELLVINKNTKEVLIKFEDPTQTYNKYRDSNPDYKNFIFKDHKGNKIGVVRKTEGRNLSVTYSIETYDKKIYTLGDITSSKVPMEVTKTLILNNYLGSGERSLAYRQQLAAEAEADRKAQAKADEQDYLKRSLVNGILILEDGKELKGEFRVDFRETAEGKVKNNEGNIISLDGKTITHYYKDDKGKDKAKIYKEKQIRSFRVIKEDDPNYDEYYCMLEYLSTPEKAAVITADGLDVMGLGKNLLGGNKPKSKKALVYKLSDKKKTTIYLSGNKLFVQNKTNNTKAQELTRSKFEEQLKNIASDCPSVVEIVENHDYQYTIKSILAFAEDYDNCQ